MPQASETLRQAAHGLNEYRLEMKLDDDQKTLAMAETLTFTNRTGDTLRTLVLRTWLGAYETPEASPAALEEIYDACYPDGFSAGGLTLHGVTWNGKAAAWRYLDAENTALEIDIPALAAGETGEMQLHCVARLPRCVHRTGYWAGEYRLNHVVPLLSVYENGAWKTQPYAPVGDPFVSECANFTVALRLPEGFTPACTAWLSQSETGLWRGEALAARDLGLCVYRDVKTAQGKTGDTLVLAYADTAAGAKGALRAAQRALACFEALYGDYPYPVYTVCAAYFPFGGMEYPAMTLIGRDYFTPGKEDSLELVAAHETAHQWFYALAGSDQFGQPWQDEAICEYAMLRYVQKRYGASACETLKAQRVDAAMQDKTPGTLTPGSPIDYFAAYADYATVVYGRGAALLLALDEMLPGGADAFLRAYAARFAFQLVSRNEFEAFLNDYAGMDCSPLLLDYLDTVM